MSIERPSQALHRAALRRLISGPKTATGLITALAIAASASIDAYAQAPLYDRLRLVTPANTTTRLEGFNVRRLPNQRPADSDPKYDLDQVTFRHDRFIQVGTMKKGQTAPRIFGLGETSILVVDREIRWTTDNWKTSRGRERIFDADGSNTLIAVGEQFSVIHFTNEYFGKKKIYFNYFDHDTGEETPLNLGPTPLNPLSQTPKTNLVTGRDGRSIFFSQVATGTNSFESQGRLLINTVEADRRRLTQKIIQLPNLPPNTSLDPRQAYPNATGEIEVVLFGNTPDSQALYLYNATTNQVKPLSPTPGFYNSQPIPFTATVEPQTGLRCLQSITNDPKNGIHVVIECQNPDGTAYTIPLLYEKQIGEINLFRRDGSTKLTFSGFDGVVSMIDLSAKNENRQKNFAILEIGPPLQQVAVIPTVHTAR